MTERVVIPVVFLGQAGFRLDFGGTVVYIDPYLSDRVERMEGPALRRMRAAPFPPEAVTDADFVFITHGHMDHCDPDTLMPLLAASPSARIIGPHAVIASLVEGGMPPERGMEVADGNIPINSDLLVHVIPAAHPRIERDAAGRLLCVGFVFEFRGRKIYHSGDTSPDDEIIAALQGLAPVDAALLPINEKNFYRDKQGIIGNMSIREAFGMATDMQARVMVPMHYDMFGPNLAYLDELDVVYRETNPPFAISVAPGELVL